VIRRITIAVLAAFLVGAVLAVPATSASGSAVVAKKKHKKKCKKKKKKGRKAAATAKKHKKAKKCKKGGGSSSGRGLPGQATPSSPKQPDPPATPATLHVKSVAVSPDTVLAGNPATGQVTVDANAPAGGQQVDLQVTGAPSVSVPGSVVVIPAGQKTAAFSVATTQGVAATATVTASIGTSTATGQLKVVDKPSVKSVRLVRQCFTPGTWADNLVTLDVPAPSNTVVSLSNDPSGSLVPTTPTVTVLAGSISAAFSVEALSVDTPQASIFAAAPETPAQSASASVSIDDPATEVTGLTIDPDEIAPGHETGGTVTLSCEAPPGGTDVTISVQSGDASGLTFPATVHVDAGELSASFTIAAQPEDVPESTNEEYTIGADAGGGHAEAALKVTSVHTT
jgi:hypothetical protein